MAGSPFSIRLTLGSASPLPDEMIADAFIDLPKGIRWWSWGGEVACLPWETDFGTKEGTVMCGNNHFPPGPPAPPAQGSVELVAAQPGPYTPRVRLVPLWGFDPNPQNNTVFVPLQVRPPQLGVKRFALQVRRVAPPISGIAYLVSASFDVVDRPTGDRIVIGAVRCRSGHRTWKQTGLDASGKAECGFGAPETARGSVFRGSVIVALAGQQMTKSFAVRLR